MEKPKLKQKFEGFKDKEAIFRITEFKNLSYTNDLLKVEIFRKAMIGDRKKSNIVLNQINVPNRRDKRGGQNGGRGLIGKLGKGILSVKGGPMSVMGSKRGSIRKVLFLFFIRGFLIREVLVNGIL